MRSRLSFTFDYKMYLIIVFIYLYLPFSVPVDCEVGRWGRWEECNALCGLGRTERSRKVLVSPKNGGKICPKLRQKRRCMGEKCYEIQDVTYQGQEIQGEWRFVV